LHGFYPVKVHPKHLHRCYYRATINRLVATLSFWVGQIWLSLSWPLSMLTRPAHPLWVEENHCMKLQTKVWTAWLVAFHSLVRACTPTGLQAYEIGLGYMELSSFFLPCEWGVSLDFLQKYEHCAFGMRLETMVYCFSIVSKHWIRCLWKRRWKRWIRWIFNIFECHRWADPKAA
jgi:hypothetical protein